MTDEVITLAHALTAEHHIPVTDMPVFNPTAEVPIPAPEEQGPSLVELADVLSQFTKLVDYIARYTEQNVREKLSKEDVDVESIVEQVIDNSDFGDKVREIAREEAESYVDDQDYATVDYVDSQVPGESDIEEEVTNQINNLSFRVEVY